MVGGCGYCTVDCGSCAEYVLLFFLLLLHRHISKLSMQIQHLWTVGEGGDVFFTVLYTVDPALTMLSCLYVYPLSPMKHEFSDGNFYPCFHLWGLQMDCFVSFHLYTGHGNDGS